MKWRKHMSLISEKDQQTLQKLFEELEGDVTITNFIQRESPLIIPGQECDYCKETRELLEEVTALSDKLHLETQGSGKGKIRFFGIPAGYEFSTLVEDLLDLSKGVTTLSEKSRTALREVDQDLHIQVFVTPTCPYCPSAARLAHKLAMENEHITADVIEISEFVDLAQRYRVQGVPKTVINDCVEFAGALPEPRFVQQVLQALEKGEAGA
jgi:alkyl hydroperoxide reductase subunit AhpF